MFGSKLFALLLLSAPNGHIVLYVPERYATDGQFETMRLLWTGIPQTTFFILFLITAVSFGWLHYVVWGMLRRATPHLEHQFEQRQPEAYGSLRTRH